MTPKERVWLEAYLACWNATEAARRAGYKWPNKTGPAKLAKFRAEIQAEIEALTMAADEVLRLLAERARLDISPYLARSEDGISFDLDRFIADGHGRHIKAIIPTRYGTRIEFHDAAEALTLIGRHHGLFSDRLKLAGDDEPVELIIRYEGRANENESE